MISSLLMIPVSQYYRRIFIDFIFLILTALEIALRNSAENGTFCFFLRLLRNYCKSISIFFLISESDIEDLFSFPLFHLSVIIFSFRRLLTPLYKWDLHLTPKQEKTFSFYLDSTNSECPKKHTHTQCAMRVLAHFFNFESSCRQE